MCQSNSMNGSWKFRREWGWSPSELFLSVLQSAVRTVRLSRVIITSISKVTYSHLWVAVESGPLTPLEPSMQPVHAQTLWARVTRSETGLDQLRFQTFPIWLVIAVLTIIYANSVQCSTMNKAHPRLAYPFYSTSGNLFLAVPWQ